MREILFRGKRIDTGEWIEGSCINDGRCFIAIHPSLAFGPTSKDEIDGETLWGFYPFFEVDPSTVGICVPGITDKNGERIFEGDIVRYYHHKKSLVPVTDIKPEEDHYGKDEESGLPLAYRTTKIIRYKGYVELHPIWGMTINLKNRCKWWRNLNYEDDSITADRLEVIGNIHDNPELLEVHA